MGSLGDAGPRYDAEDHYSCIGRGGPAAVKRANRRHTRVWWLMTGHYTLRLNVPFPH
jgi:hypothetical protein